MTIGQFLQGNFEYQFTELNIQTVLARRNIYEGVDHTEVSERDRDLCLADLYMILANVLNGQGRRVQKGNRSVTERSFTFGITDRENFRKEALRLYSKWGENQANDNVVFTTIYEP